MSGVRTLMFKCLIQQPFTECPFYARHHTSFGNRKVNQSDGNSYFPGFRDAFRTPQKQHAINRQLHGVSTILVGKPGFSESYCEGLLSVLRPKGRAEG